VKSWMKEYYLDASVINQPKHEATENGSFFSSLPPYYVPEKLNVSFDEGKNSFQIIFHYMNHFVEGVDEYKLADSITVCFGKKSGRVHKIALNLEALRLGLTGSKASKAKALKQKLSKSLSDSEEKGSVRYRNSFSAAEAIFENYGEKVFAQAC